MRSKHASCLPIVLFEQYSSPTAITQLGKYNCVINLNIHIGSLSYPSFGLDRCMKGSEPRPTGFRELRTRGLYVGSKAVTAIAAGKRTAWLPHPDNTGSSLNCCGPLLFQTCLCWRELLSHADGFLNVLQWNICLLLYCTIFIGHYTPVLSRLLHTRNCKQ